MFYLAVSSLFETAVACLEMAHLHNFLLVAGENYFGNCEEVIFHVRGLFHIALMNRITHAESPNLRVCNVRLIVTVDKPYALAVACYDIEGHTLRRNHAGAYKAA